jgi:hypothetical protein
MAGRWGFLMIDPPTLQSVKDVFSLLRDSIGLVKDAKGLLPAAQQRAVDESLDKAERATVLAEAQIAKALGYQLHDCTFPPQIMLAVKTPHGEEKRCPACGHMTDFNAPLRGSFTSDYDPYEKYGLK